MRNPNNPAIEIIAVHVANRLAVTDTGELLELTNLFDEFGEDTHDADRAVCAVGLSSAGWFTVDFRDFWEVDTVH